MRLSIINKRRKEEAAETHTSTVVMLLPWTFMTAVWMKSKPEPITTIFLPPLPKQNKTINSKRY